VLSHITLNLCVASGKLIVCVKVWFDKINAVCALAVPAIRVAAPVLLLVNLTISEFASVLLSRMYAHLLHDVEEALNPVVRVSFIVVFPAADVEVPATIPAVTPDNAPKEVRSYQVSLPEVAGDTCTATSNPFVEAVVFVIAPLTIMAV
jgi:hypothetical protein